MNKLSELMECLRPENSEPEEVDEFIDINVEYWEKRLRIQKELLSLEGDSQGSCPDERVN